jgi:hypothetical protein
LTLFCGCCLCTRRILTCTYISANRQDMTSVPYFCCACRALATLAALGGTVARDDDGTDKLNFRACLHGFPFPGVLEKVPWVYPFRIVRVRLRVRWIGWTRFFRMWIWPFDFAMVIVVGVQSTFLLVILYCSQKWYIQFVKHGKSLFLLL